MKTLLLIGLFLVTHSTFYGQDQSRQGVLNAGLNGSFFGSGDVIGLSLCTNYDFNVNKFIAISPRITLGATSSADEFNYDNSSSFTLSTGLLFTPLPNRFSNLKFEVGGLYHKFSKAYGRIEAATSYGTYTSISSEFYIENLWGLIGSIRVNIADNENFIAGLRGDMLTSFTEGYYNCDSIQFGFFFGLKL